ncbi:MAG: hypothetical protein ACOC0Z_08840, partial [Halohasta sp.]
MRFKWVVEPPATIAAVGAIQEAIPLVPASEADCLRRLVDRTDHINDRETAREWLTFLRALGLVDRTASGYRRTRQEPSADVVAERLLDSIYGARELQETLAAADGPLSVDAIVDGSGVNLPTWERHHHTDPEGVRRRRLRRLADWFV